ncbi:hypothetical protein [Alcanivorax jadensis]|uniref:hypothetical protein n=1 Tax=Alcanivorax jadensis TaxID=64988 RepID=UPI0026ED611F|nr:hypothetical protein [Alcanivorax jadensis]MCK5887908.1 hypothetical protein [Alcanivorax sp.]
MEKSVYEPPSSDVDLSKSIEIPEDISKKIKNGWIAAIISGVMTLGVMLLAINTGAMGDLFDIWTGVDVIIIFLLAFGIYKKSRFSATFMFAYFLIAKILIIVETGKPSGLIMSMIFLYFYFQAMIGTYQYHKIIKIPKASMKPTANVPAD